MDKQKIAELAKQLEALVEQDGEQNKSDTTRLNIDIYKHKDRLKSITVRTSRFSPNPYGFNVNWVSLDEESTDTVIDGITFQYRYFKAVPKVEVYE